MAQIDSLRAHLVDELADALDAERQLITALPKMAKAASSAKLRAAFQSHLKETRRHATRLQQAMRQLGERVTSKTCEGMKGLLEEGEEMMGEAPEGAVRDAMMISAAQKVEHYEISGYGTARTYAQLLGERGVARLLEQTLREEKAADVKLTTIAEGSVNKRASEQWAAESAKAQNPDGLLTQSGKWLSATATQAAKALGLAADKPKQSRGKKRGGSQGRRRQGARKK